MKWLWLPTAIIAAWALFAWSKTRPGGVGAALKRLWPVLAVAMVVGGIWWFVKWYDGRPTTPSTAPAAPVLRVVAEFMLDAGQDTLVPYAGAGTVRLFWANREWGSVVATGHKPRSGTNRFQDEDGRWVYRIPADTSRIESRQGGQIRIRGLHDGTVVRILQ